MKTSSPLRYPGGKSALAGVISQIRRLNGFGDRAMAEPFAGGAGASLTLLYLEETPKIYINDADDAIYDFWWCLTRRSKRFCEILKSTRINMSEWRRQRDAYRSARTSRLRKGFSTFFLNRCNRSGIIMNGGPIGGIRQTGRWKLGARYNKDDLLRRCEKVAEYSDRIRVSGLDGIKFIEQTQPAKTFYFIDPPYFAKGNSLYLNILTESYHAKLGAHLRAMTDSAWVLTYDDCPEIRRIYRGWATIKPFKLRYAAYDNRTGKEILIAPKWMRLPTAQQSEAIVW